ncbi:tRNA m(1)G37 methyltransferase [Candidatus Xenohaliotis californiensis]|uniref:tRNA (guanine-N(1)-)-methyltransferase n=1 Tax=Candidatus Xenohaliotis californiensis TaxID=84677 RepID=A0ABP0ETF0_9RICK|nr:tRNA m(1)G37 methyltransferase [Candidatus Xenohaliotis californiensis]
MFSVKVITAFPDMFPGPLSKSVVGRALYKKFWDIDVIDIRSFTTDKRQSIDDRPYGGGSGMLIKPEVLASAIDYILKPGMRILNTSPRGRLLSYDYAKDIARSKNIILICGHYEGIDQRVLDFYNVEDISIGDYVLSGGELAAMVIIDSCVRLLPGVLKNDNSLDFESFTCCRNASALLEYNQYTRPLIWRNMRVPDILLSGHHDNIDKWRIGVAEMITKQRRSDLWQIYRFNKDNCND